MISVLEQVTKNTDAPFYNKVYDESEHSYCTDCSGELEDKYGRNEVYSS